MPADFRFVADAAKAHSDVLPVERPCNAFYNRRFADARRAHKTNYRLALFVGELSDGKEFQNSFLDFFKPVVVFVKDFPCIFDVVVIFALNPPRQIEHKVEIVSRNCVIGA